MIRQDLTIKDLREALYRLDRYLERYSPGETVSIRAVGGFALMFHGLRRNGVTADIDTITPSYSHGVYKAIEAVATELNLASDWLNNDAVFSFEDVVTEDDVAFFDAELEALYVDSGWNYRHIQLDIADIDTLIKAKSMAVRDIDTGRSDVDLRDLVDLLDKRGIHSLSEFKKTFRWASEPDFKECLTVLQGVMGNKETEHDHER